MNSSSNNSLTSDNAPNNCLNSKLRRLKIQESVLSATVNKCFLLNAEEIDEKIKYDSDMQLKKYFSTLKEKFREVKHLFEDITLKTNDQYMEKSGKFTKKGISLFSFSVSYLFHYTRLTTVRFYYF